MNVVATSLEALLYRVINSENQSLDNAAIEAFCAIVIKEVDGVPLASKLLAFWIQSTIENQALQALTLLDNCMQKCGPLFVSEVGKFRFLNEMIKLVSPKYLGNKTPISVQEKVLNLLQQWTINFPREKKIKEAYEMLKKQGVIKDDYNLASTSENLSQSIKVKSPVFDDEEKSKLLQKLLKSKNPDDLHAANRLIKTMVKEDEKRSQQDLRRVMELESVHNNVKLLSDMLNSYIPNETNKEDIELMKELYEACQRLQPTIERLAQETPNNEEMLLEIVKASEDLEKVRNKYSRIILLNLPPDSPTNTIKYQEALLDLSSPDMSISSSTEPSNINKDTDLLIDCQSDIDVLKDVFSSPSNVVESMNFLDEQMLFSKKTLMQPIKVKDIKLKGERDKVLEDLNEFDGFLLKENLSDPKIQRYHKSSHESTAVSSLDNLLQHSDLQNFTKGNFVSGNENDKTAQASLNIDADIDTLNVNTSHGDKLNNDSDLKIIDEFKIQSLADININLETITPGNISPVTVIDECNGITVVLHFAKDNPRVDVSVIVVTTMSKNVKPLKDYLFQAVVPKNCKCRLQSPSTTELPPHNPFLPPSAISQIMLIANPYKEKLSLKFMLSYSMDGETITEMGEVERLPIT